MSKTFGTRTAYKMSFLQDQRKFFFLVVFIVATALIYYIMNINLLTGGVMTHINKMIRHKSNDYFITGDPYLIRTPTCRVSAYHYFSRKIPPYKLFPYVPCPQAPVSSHVLYKNGTPYLHIEGKILVWRSFINCCNALIRRKDLHLSNCTDFNKQTPVFHPEVQVMCFNFVSNLQVYENVHAVLSPKLLASKLKVEIPKKAIPKKPYSILILGLSNVSRLNMMRALPRTDLFLETMNFSTLRGYSKVASDITSNLLVLLSGQSQWKPLDSPDLLFSRVKEQGYVTAYGEDITKFHLQKDAEKVIDFHLEKYMLAARRLGTAFAECYGHEYAGERILNMAQDFTLQLHDVPTFGVFWINSFTNGSINFLSVMDSKIVEFLQTIISHLDNTFFFLLSNQGFVMEELENTEAGWMEERLPFFRLLVPKNFRKKYPKKEVHLQQHAFQITNAYDVHMTLQEILQENNEKFALKKSKVGNSLFEKPITRRTCSEAGIPNELCVCHTIEFLHPESELVVKASNYVVDGMNSFVAKFPERNKCDLYFLRKIVAAGKIDENAGNQLKPWEKIMIYLVLELLPGTKFEGRIPMEYEKHRFDEIHSSTLLTFFDRKKDCVKDKSLERFCRCH